MNKQKNAKDARSLTRFMLPTPLSVFVFSATLMKLAQPTKPMHQPVASFIFIRAEDVAIGTPVGVTPASRAAALTTQRGGSCRESISIFCYHQVRCWSGMLEALV